MPILALGRAVELTMIESPLQSGVGGLVSSFSRQGHQWCPASSALSNNEGRIDDEV
jgi:hypothetical protein